MLSLFRKLLPREDRFFDLFAQHSRTIVGAAEALNELLAGKDTDAQLRLDFPIHAAEQTNLIEEEGQALPLDNGALNVHIGHHAIETFKLTPG